MENALPGISAMKPTTRSLSSSSSARATRAFPSAARRTAAGRRTSSRTAVTASIDAGSENPTRNMDTTPINAPGRQ